MVNLGKCSGRQYLPTSSMWNREVQHPLAPSAPGHYSCSEGTAGHGSSAHQACTNDINDIINYIEMVVVTLQLMQVHKK